MTQWPIPGLDAQFLLPSLQVAWDTSPRLKGQDRRPWPHPPLWFPCLLVSLYNWCSQNTGEARLMEQQPARVSGSCDSLMNAYSA